MHNFHVLFQKIEANYRLVLKNLFDAFLTSPALPNITPTILDSLAMVSLGFISIVPLLPTT